MKAAILYWILAGLNLLNGQIVLGRRDYAELGRTFSQIWIGDPATLNFRQLTHSARDHSDPACSRDGKLIYFVSDRDAERSRNSYGGSDGREVWAYDRQTGQENFIWRTSRDFGLRINVTVANGGVLLRMDRELHSLMRSPWVISNVDEAVVSPDGRRLALVLAESYGNNGQSQNAKLFVADAASGRSRAEVGKYDEPRWSPDGMRIAAFSEGSLAIVNATTGHEIERFALPPRNGPADAIVWSPDGKRLLAGLYGENGGAGDPQDDYFLLNPATLTWTPEMTARELLWLRDDKVIYLRPYETTPLAPGSVHSVWTSQLAVYDLASRKDTALTSGLVLNDYLFTCGH